MKDGMYTGEQLLERQKKIGLVSEDAEMVDWPEVIPEWDSFSEEGKEYLARQMEVNAAFMEHVDYHVGRVIDHLEEMGELDNTMISILPLIMGILLKEHLPAPFLSCFFKMAFLH
jgi:arylsulfatase A-like enzyme